MGAEQSHDSVSSSSNKTELVPVPVARKHVVSFSINGRMYTVDPQRDNVGPEIMLVDYIRDHAFLKGTKFMCREGGCGACVVTVKTRKGNGDEWIRSINSCLIRVLSCDGWEISTVEYLGNKKTGYHQFQQRMAKFHGTQCGFCTPGWVMNIYSLMQSKRPNQLTMQDIMDATDGNICRCTGYRPILDSMKSMAVDVSEELKRKCGGIDPTGEPQGEGHGQGCQDCDCAKTDHHDASQQLVVESGLEDFVQLNHEAEDQINMLSVSNSPQMPIHINVQSGEQWVKATDLTTLFLAIREFRSRGLQFRIVGGNTGTGVFKNDGPYQGFVELNSIHALTRIDLSQARVVLGGAVTISSAIDALNKASTMEGYDYCKIIFKHWQRVANIFVRNAGTLAGNLMLKHAHREFPSDIFLTLETIGATLTIASSASMQSMHTLEEFLTMDMMGKIIHSIHFPKLMGYHLRTFKITRRYQNSHAYVNAGFLMKVTPNTLIVKEKPRIVYGGISAKFVHASMTENYLLGKTLNQFTIQGAMKTLEMEIQPDCMMPTDGLPAYRKLLTQSLLYKVILEHLGDKVGCKMKSGSTDILRGISYGKQTYDMDDKSEWPLYKPVQKLEAPFQCSGEAEYINDIAPASRELHGAFVLTKVANATLTRVDTSQALKMTGVVGWVDHKNIPGVNNYLAGHAAHKRKETVELVFVQNKIHYAGQAVGVILAETREIAIKAAKLVALFYADVKKPVLDIVTALEAGKLNEPMFETIQSPSRNIVTAGMPAADEHNLKGEFCTSHQIHFHMETQICICVPKENSMDVYASTQIIDQVQLAISSCLAVPANSINIYVQRLGGGFGGKLARSAHVAAACAIAANAMNRPVRLNMDLETNMELIGKRPPFCYTYQVHFDNMGKITQLEVRLLCDGGCTSNEPPILQAQISFQNVYEAISWKLEPGVVNTNLAPNTYCRDPGASQAMATIELIMEHIAFYLKKKPLDVRMTNFMKKGDPLFFNPATSLETENYIPMMMKELETSADLLEREKFIEKFNHGNRWKKRGLSVMPSRSPCPYWLTGFYVYISIYGHDGSIAVSHSGTEMGQGINTKVVQVVAREFNVPVEKISVKRTDNFMGPNATMTGTAITSEHVCHSAMKACGILKERMAPIKEKLGSPSWEKLVDECKMVGCDLASSYCTTFGDNLKSYDAWGLTATEVEIDCLTGEYKIIRADLMVDAGNSLSPDIDVGQVEGAFVMGIGLWTIEKTMYDQNTGELLTNRSWNYKPPMAKDIPEDFRITFMKNVPNQLGVLRSKAMGEAPFNMSFSVFLALRAAITAARMDAGNCEWCPMDAPLTVEDIQRFCLTKTSQFLV